MVVEPDGLAGAQGRDTVAWEGFKSDWNDQLCGLSSPFSPPGCAGEEEVSLPQGCNGGGTARDIDSAGDRHARNVGTAQGDPMLMARLEALESQLAQKTQLLIGLSGSVVGSCSQGLSPREDNNSIHSTPVRGDAISHSSNTGVTATVTRSVASVPCYTSVTPVGMGVVLSQGTLFRQRQLGYILAKVREHYPVGNLCIVMGARPSLRYPRLLCIRWGAHMRVGTPLEPKATQAFWQDKGMVGVTLAAGWHLMVTSQLV
uniref:Uncharacterized protein n=1 Tax=Magallana gigas TaxID=29159 RepID=K1QBX8_MAGGI